MSRHIRWLPISVVVIGLLALVAPRSIPSVLARSKSADVAPATTSLFVPLPKSCGGGLPPGADTPACCMFGYVFINGQAVAGAKVTITSVHGSVEVWTEPGPDSSQPYYRTSLSDPPLSVQAGESITISAEYSSHSRTISHQVLGGGQQVDVVLPRMLTNDYVFDRQIWRQNAAGIVNYPVDLAIDPVGNIYVADSANARIQVFNRNHQFLYQWGVLGDAPGQFNGGFHAIAVSTMGDVYVADTNQHRIQRFTSNGTFVQAWGSRGKGDSQFEQPAGIAVDKDGNVYVADTENHRIQKFNSNGVLLTKWGSYGSADGQFNSPGDIAVDKNGNVYVVEVHNYRVQKFTSTGQRLGGWGSQGSGDGQFNFPGGIAVDNSGNVFVADSWNNRIQKFTSNGGYLDRWGSSGSGNGQLSYPNGIDVDNAGNVSIADVFNHRIQTFTNTGQWLSTWAVGGSVNGQFTHPADVNFDTSGNLYVTDLLNNRVQKFSHDGSYITQWGTLGDGEGQFNNPWGIAIDSSGSVYVVDTNNHRVQKFTSSGGYITQWGTQGSGNGQFLYPTRVAIDGSGNVYVADTDNYRIQKFTSTGGYITQWGTQGSGNGQFARPHGIALDSHGNVYVADRENSRIQKFSNTGAYIGQWGIGGNGDGQFTWPEGITIDRNDSVYVADTWNHRIQRFTSSGAWLGTWGREGNGLGQFTLPAGIAVDTSGALFVADRVDNRIQIFRPMAYTRPIATIVAATPRSVVQGQPVELLGMGGDSDTTPTIVAYQWSLDGNSSPFATAAQTTLSTSTLSPGQHTIAFRVRDTEGEYSDSQTISIDVSAAAPAQTWTFLLYLDGDNGLGPYLNRDSPLGALYKLEHSSPNPNVHVVALYDGDRPGGGDSFRYVMQPGGQLTQQALGEVDMGDPHTLVDFVQWGKQQAPADHYYLAIADHANGLDGIAWDFTSDPNEHLTNAEIRQALVAITENGAHPIDVLHFDGCLMGLIENAYQVRNLARYVVASENLGWSAFAYELYRAAVGAQTSPATFASDVAEGYALQVKNAGFPYTIAAVDMSQLNTVTQKTDALASELLRYALASAANRTTLQNLRTQAQKFDSSGDIAITNDDEYVDLDHLASLLQSGVSDPNVQSAAGQLRVALLTFVITEHQASGSVYGIPIDVSHARGVGIYYPPRPGVKTYQTYVQGEFNFVTDTHWDEFLAAGLAPLPFDPRQPKPNPVPPLPLRLKPRVYLSLVRR